MAISEVERVAEGPSKENSTDGVVTVYRDRALASLDHEWELRDEKANDGYLGTLAGHFAVFDRWTEIDSPLEGHFLERVAKGSFSKTFAENRKNMRVLLNHGKDPSVGMKPLGPIRTLEEDSTGAYYEVALLDTSYNRDLVPGLRDGQFGASFRFQIRAEDFNQWPERSDHNPDGIPESTIREAKVREFGPVTFGQYEGATAGLRSLNDDLVGLELELMARSDPQAVADFARIISSGYASSQVMRPFVAGKRGRNNPTDVDYGMLYSLKQLKASIAETRGTQLTDPDDGADTDDAAVTAALGDAEAAIDKAIVAQAADCRPDDDGGNGSMSSYAKPEVESDKSREAETSPDGLEASEVPHESESDASAPADGAPVHGPKPMGATLKKRAAPLRTKRTSGDPVWKL